MRADDPKLKRLEPPRLKWHERVYLPRIAEGLGVTARHIGGRDVRQPGDHDAVPRGAAHSRARTIAACTG